jgi:polyisoprenoid-binding protein YceI
MRLLTQIRALFVLVVLASHSPLGFGVEANAIAPVQNGSYSVDRALLRLIFRVGYVGLSTFTGRFTRFEATMQFDPTKAAVSRCPSRYVRRSIAAQVLV